MATSIGAIGQGFRCQLAAERSTLPSTKLEIVFRTRRYLAAIHGPAHVGIAAQVLAFIEGIRTISISRTAVSVFVSLSVVVAVPIIIIALSVPVIVIGTGFIIPLS
jgi:hypothetical protein